jgi:predicted permease
MRPSSLYRRIRALLRSEAIHEEIDEEMRFHIAMRAEENVRRGMEPDEAQRDAERRFGGLTRAKERGYEVRGGGALESLLRDVRYAARMLAKRPGFTAVAVLTLALGIGANTAIFSVVDGVLLKPLSLPDPERLVAVSEHSTESTSTPVAYPNYLDWRARQTVFEDLAARMPTGGVLTGDGGPERITGRSVSASFFHTLGVRPAAGRFFEEDEDRPGGPALMILGHGLWRRRFGADPAVVGKSILYNGEVWTVAGVMPPDFDYYGANNANNDFFTSLGRLADQKYMRDRNSHPLEVTARLKRGVTLERARAEMSAIAAALAQEHPASNEGRGVALKSFLDDYVGDVRPALLTISAAVLLVLLIACANVANLLLARAPSRRKEVAVRTALGASRRRVVRQLLIESVLLSAAGGAAGLLLAWVGVDLLVRLDPYGLPRTEAIAVDPRVLGFTLLVTLLTGVVFGLVPALQTSKVDLNDALKEGGQQRQSGGAGSNRLRGALVLGQVAISLVLLVGAGLLVKSFWQLSKVEPGFDPRGVLTLRLRLPDAKYREASHSMDFLREVVRRVSDLPGVEAAAVSAGFPLGRGRESGYVVEGQPEPQKPADWAVAVSQSIGEGYYKTLGIRLLAGRDFDRSDMTDSPPVVIVDDAFTRRHFPGVPLNDALGKRLRFDGDEEPWREIVGVVNHVRQDGPEQEGHAGVYRPWTQMSPRWMADFTRAMDLVVKTSADPESLVPAVRREVQAVDPEQPLANVRTLQSLLDETVAPRRFGAVLVGAFALVALLLGAVGLYGVMSYVVSQRTHEIGIRMALGAQRGRILRSVLARGMSLVIAGVALGLAGSLAAARLIASQLFGVKPFDPQTIFGVSALLVSVALVACYLPARRATRVDPLTALRHE